MAQGRIDAVVVGADRVSANGDTANKIGTLSLAVSASHYGIPFFVAAPSTSIDLNLVDGSQIRIEERPGKEVTHMGERRVVVDGMNVWNPAFDVTPASLIDGIVTEVGTVLRSAGALKVSAQRRWEGAVVRPFLFRSAVGLRVSIGGPGLGGP